MTAAVADCGLAGVERVFHWTLVEAWGSPAMPDFFDQMGLVYNGLGDESAPRYGRRREEGLHDRRIRSWRTRSRA